MVDKCAAIVAMRHTRSEVVTASLDSVDFRSGVRVGNILVLTGRLNAVFRSSMEVEVEVRSEDPLTGERHLTTRAFVTMVAMNSGGSATRAKVDAARELGIPIVMVARPAATNGETVATAPEALDWLQR